MVNRVLVSRPACEQWVISWVTDVRKIRTYTEQFKQEATKRMSEQGHKIPEAAPTKGRQKLPGLPTLGNVAHKKISEPPAEATELYFPMKESWAVDELRSGLPQGGAPPRPSRGGCRPEPWSCSL